MSPSKALLEPPEFSLVLGGPLYQLFRRAHLSGDVLELVRRRVVLISLIAWLPLFALAALNGQLLAGANIPFLTDVEVHVRFLIAMPLLIVAELVVHGRMRLVIKEFLDRDLIPDAGKARFDAALSGAFRLRNSVAAELLLIAFVYAVGVLVVWRHFTVLQTDTWYATTTAEGSRLTPAGIWYGFAAMPMFQFLLLRWYFRIFIWTRFLWQVSRIDLHMIPTHPDRLAGLGFLSQTAYAFVPLALAHGAVLSGMIADRIFHLGATLTAFKFEIGAVAVFVQCLVFFPLLPFVTQLSRAKRTGLGEYGRLAARYVREFDAKWLRGGAADGEALIGSGDIQSLADLSNAFDIVRGMRIAPVTREAIVQLAVATLMPVGPLLLTMMPLEELLRTLLGVLF